MYPIRSFPRTWGVTLVLAGLVLAAMAVSQVPAGAAGRDEPTGAQLARVRHATAHYHDVQHALDDGYELASPCVPGMGFHYARSVAPNGDALDPLAPEILVYAPRPNGSLQLVAVEYASWEPAELFGQSFDPPHGDGPPFHTLHAWVWRGNPDGVFTAHNRTVACP